MEAELVALASTAGTTVVSLLVTDSWTTARDAMVALWKRVHPQRSGFVADELGEARAALLTALRSGDATVQKDLVGEWQGKVRRLLATDPDASEELRRLLREDLLPALPPAQTKTINLHAHASGTSQVNQAGGNLHVHNRGRGYQ
ncbi:hypothetical protein [Micromonospora maritima]|uniref:hypothetical protein n=1 Tax=Micromonospora maritima TaxID=986711 RepID=UPI00157C15C4|nr:hypothetical protein [Micromonospora maritima]